METYQNLGVFWEDKISSLNCHRFAQAYISNLLSRPETIDLSKDSLTLFFAQARETQNFEKFQTLADYLFFAESIFPDALSLASREYYQSLARLSYYSCFRLINRKLYIYEYLADEFIHLTKKVNSISQAIDKNDYISATFQI